ncbi:MAG: ABC transporter substrate-binding protein, partial [Olegusella sp.]|nr:ABC transporter substrate-binding protein [Olegusella sp.]
MADHSMTRRTFAKGSLAASALAALAACGKNNTAASGSGSGATAAAGNVFNFYINDPVAIDPYNTQ